MTFSLISTPAIQVQPASQPQKLVDSVSSLQQSITAACNNKSKDLTAAKIDRQFKGINLSKIQQHYVTDYKKVAADLEQTYYSNAKLCQDGPAIVALIQNVATLAPATSIIGSLGGSTLPSASQMATLKDLTTKNLTNQAALAKLLPSSAALLSDTKTLLDDVYFEVAAAQKGDVATALKYDGQVQQLGAQVDTETKDSDTETTNYDKK